MIPEFSKDFVNIVTEQDPKNKDIVNTAIGQDVTKHIEQDVKTRRLIKV